MREVNVRRQQGMGLDNGDGVEHGYGAEHTSGTAGGRLRQWHIEGQRRGDGSTCVSVDIRQSSRGWAGSGVGAKVHSNREVKGGRGGDIIGIPLLHWPL